MTLNTMTLAIESPMVYTKYGVAISVTGIAQVSVGIVESQFIFVSTRKAVPAILNVLFICTYTYIYLSHSMTKPWASVQSDWSLLCTFVVAKDQCFLIWTAKTLIRLRECPG